MCKLEATGVDGRLFRANIKIPGVYFQFIHRPILNKILPGTKLRKSSFNFIQWKDDEKGKKKKKKNYKTDVCC